VISGRQRARKRGHVEIAESKERKQKEKRVRCRKKARTHSETVPELKDPQVEAKKEIEAKKFKKKK
jgi:hypothetical protein